MSISGAGGHERVAFGDSLDVAGRVGSRARRPVRLEYRGDGGGWRPVTQVSTAADGSYRFSVRPEMSGSYRAVADGSASAARRVTVIASLSGRSGHHVRRGRSVGVRGALRPGLRGRKVALQLRGRGGWKTVDRARTGRGGRFKASWRASKLGSYRLRVKFRGDGSNAAVSRTLRGRVYVYRASHASWYGPGFYGNRTACGSTMNASVVGVANKSLPCGTRVTFRYRGRSVTAKVIDRGPYAAGRDWDLTPATKRRLGFPSTGTVLSTR